MSSWVDIEIEKLELKIPKKDFPLKSDVIVGFEYPKLMIMVDEDEEEYLHFEEQGDYYYFLQEGGESIFGRYNYDTPIEELKELCIKYGGTIIAKETDEEDNTEYTRVRGGVSKKVKVVEEN